eukprot:COSAG02_NODE_954_length_15689_cov_14.145927_2_plen_51_part_00
MTLAVAPTALALRVVVLSPPLNQLCCDAGGDNFHLGEVGGRPPTRATWLR